MSILQGLHRAFSTLELKERVMKGTNKGGMILPKGHSKKKYSWSHTRPRVPRTTEEHGQSLGDIPSFLITALFSRCHLFLLLA